MKKYEKATVEFVKFNEDVITMSGLKNIDLLGNDNNGGDISWDN